MNKTIMILVIAISLILSGCITPNETVEHSDKESVIEIPTPEPTPTLSTPVDNKNIGAIITLTAPPGTEVILQKEYDGIMMIYDIGIADDYGEVKIIAPVMGTYTVITPFSEHLVSVEEEAIMCCHIIMVQ